MKIVGYLGAVALVTTFAGCTTTRSGGIQQSLQNSLPRGALPDNSGLLKSAQATANTPNVNNVLNTVNAANGAAATTPGTVNNTLTPLNIYSAVQAALTANTAKQAAAENPNAFGPGVMVGPGIFDTGGVMTGPGAYRVNYGN